jgi:DNA primase
MPAPIIVDHRDPVGQNEREALKIALRAPALAGPAFDDLDADEFTLEPYAEVRRAIAAAGGVTMVTDLDAWPGAVGDHVANESLRTLVRELLVEEPKIADHHVTQCLMQIRVRSTGRRVDDIKRQLQRINPIKHPEEHTRLFGQLIALEKYKRDLLSRVELG